MSQPLPDNTEQTPAAPQPATPAPPTPAPTAPPSPPPTAARPDNPFSVEQTLRSIADTLAALPERVVNGVREAGQASPPPPVVNTPQPTNQPPAGASAQTATAKKRTFGDWWFNKS